MKREVRELNNEETKVRELDRQSLDKFLGKRNGLTKCRETEGQR